MLVHCTILPDIQILWNRKNLPPPVASLLKFSISTYCTTVAKFFFFAHIIEYVWIRSKSCRNPIFQEQLLFSGEFLKVRSGFAKYKTGASASTEIKIKCKESVAHCVMPMLVKGQSSDIKIGNNRQPHVLWAWSYSFKKENFHLYHVPEHALTVLYALNHKNTFVQNTE